MSEQFCLKWNNHQTTLVSVFDKLLECESLVDCSLAAEGKTLKAHKVVLSACSSYLEDILRNHEGKHPIIIFNDISFNELKAMLEYMYRGEVNVSQEQLNTFLKAAEALKIKGLTDQGGGGGNDGGGQENLKRKMGAARKTHSPVMGMTPVERPSSPKRRKPVRRQSRDENFPGDSNSCDTAPTPPPSQPQQINSIAARIEEKVAKIKKEKDSSGGTPAGGADPPGGAAALSALGMLQPKTEFLEESGNVEDLTLEEEEEYGPNPGTSQGSFSSQDFNNWQLGDPTNDEVFMASQHDLNNSAGNSQGTQTYFSSSESEEEVDDPKQQSPSSEFSINSLEMLQKTSDVLVFQIEHDDDDDDGAAGRNVELCDELTQPSSPAVSSEYQQISSSDVNSETDFIGFNIKEKRQSFSKTVMQQMAIEVAASERKLEKQTSRKRDTDSPARRSTSLDDLSEIPVDLDIPVVHDEIIPVSADVEKEVLDNSAARSSPTNSMNEDFYVDTSSDSGSFERVCSELCEGLPSATSLVSRKTFAERTSALNISNVATSKYTKPPGGEILSKKRGRKRAQTAVRSKARKELLQLPAPAAISTKKFVPPRLNVARNLKGFTKAEMLLIVQKKAILNDIIKKYFIGSIQRVDKGGKHRRLVGAKQATSVVSKINKMMVQKSDRRLRSEISLGE